MGGYLRAAAARKVHGSGSLFCLQPCGVCLLQPTIGQYKQEFFLEMAQLYVDLRAALHGCIGRAKEEGEAVDSRVHDLIADLESDRYSYASALAGEVLPLLAGAYIRCTPVICE